MTTVTINGFVMKAPYNGSPVFVNCDMSEHGYLMIGPHEFDYEIPETFNPVAAEVESLNKKLAAVNKDHSNAVKAIKDRIANLLCIEYSPEQSK